MPDLVNSVLTLYAGKLVNARIEVVRDFREQAVFYCLEGGLRQALNNLIGNAIDAMRGGGRLIVRVRRATDFATDRAGIRLTIADTGTGMGSVTRARIFDAFFTTKGILGTGLGLWITQELVEKENGSLRVRSREVQPAQLTPLPHGTVFALFLPETAVAGNTVGGAVL